MANLGLAEATAGAVAEATTAASAAEFFLVIGSLTFSTATVAACAAVVAFAFAFLVDGFSNSPLRLGEAEAAAPGSAKTAGAAPSADEGIFKAVVGTFEADSFFSSLINFSIRALLAFTVVLFPGAPASLMLFCTSLQ